jgi:hypothetical protein
MRSIGEGKAEKRSAVLDPAAFVAANYVPH